MAEIDDLIVKKVKKFLFKLKESGVSVDFAYLFGSYAKRSSSKFSDIDVAVISSDFSEDRFEEGIKLARIAGKIDNRIEPIPFTIGNFVEDDPLVWEIKKDGILIDDIGI
ncbi:MAG: nucleotidyltransferase domain-containing protein [Thermodesulfobacteriota bacterium]|nr:nucleotidyltransferase domain-containing protein [Thermodesulfobacteriota bacterium]